MTEKMANHLKDNKQLYEKNKLDDKKEIDVKNN